MKIFKMTLVLICTFLSTKVFAAEITSVTLEVENDTRYAMVYEYSCNFSGANCVVNKINTLKSGQEYWDAYCDGVSRIMKSSTEKRAICHAKNSSTYCTLEKRILKD